MARYYVNPASCGLTYTSREGVSVYAPKGVFIDTAQAQHPPPANWAPPPDCHTLWPCDAAAQTALQKAIDAKRAAWPGGDAHGLPGGLPDEIPIWSP
jgi:hypothetical protein